MKSDLGWTIMAEFVFLSLGGYAIDLKTGGGYYFTFTGIGLAFFLIGYEIWKACKEEDRK